MYTPSLVLTMIITLTWGMVLVWKETSSGKDFFERILQGLYLRPCQEGEKLLIFTPANVMTCIGLLAVLGYPLASTGTTLTKDEAVWLIIIGGLSDAFDGFLARATHQCTRIGAIIDPLRDRFFVLAILGVMVIKNRELSLNVTAIGIVASEAIIVWNHFYGNQYPGVHLFGKIRMVIHIVCGLIFVLADGGILWLQLDNQASYLSWIMLCASLLALYGYRKPVRATMATSSV